MKPGSLQKKPFSKELGSRPLFGVAGWPDEQLERKTAGSKGLPGSIIFWQYCDGLLEVLGDKDSCPNSALKILESYRLNDMAYNNHYPVQKILCTLSVTGHPYCVHCQLQGIHIVYIVSYRASILCTLSVTEYSYCVHCQLQGIHIVYIVSYRASILCTLSDTGHPYCVHCQLQGIHIVYIVSYRAYILCTLSVTGHP